MNFKCHLNLATLFASGQTNLSPPAHTTSGYIKGGKPASRHIAFGRPTTPYSQRTLYSLPNYSQTSTCVSVSPCTSARPASRSVMAAGSSTVWSMASSRTVRCPATRPSGVVTIPSTRSSARLELASTCPVLSSSILSPLLLVSHKTSTLICTGTRRYSTKNNHWNYCTY